MPSLDEIREQFSKPSAPTAPPTIHRYYSSFHRDSNLPKIQFYNREFGKLNPQTLFPLVIDDISGYTGRAVSFSKSYKFIFDVVDGMSDKQILALAEESLGGILDEATIEILDFFRYEMGLIHKREWCHNPIITNEEDYKLFMERCFKRTSYTIEPPKHFLNSPHYDGHPLYYSPLLKDGEMYCINKKLSGNISIEVDRDRSTFNRITVFAFRVRVSVWESF